MAQVSKTPIQPWIKKEIMDSFFWTLAKLNKQNEVELLLDDLLTTTEKTMLAKRLAIALLIAKEYSYRDIRDILKVSTTTILLVNRWMEKGGQGYKIAIKKLITREEIDRFMKDLAKSVGTYIGKNLRFG